MYASPAGNERADYGHYQIIHGCAHELCRSRAHDESHCQPDDLVLLQKFHEFLAKPIAPPRSEGNGEK